MCNQCNSWSGGVTWSRGFRLRTSLAAAFKTLWNVDSGATGRQAQPVASLGLVSPGAATDGVTPIPPQTPKNWRHFLVIATKWWPFLNCRLVKTPQLPSSDIVLSSVLCKFSFTIFFPGFHPRIVSHGVVPRTSFPQWRHWSQCCRMNEWHESALILNAFENWRRTGLV